MISALNLIIAAGLLAILYGYIVSKQILSASPGNAKMQEIASAIQEGARAYLNQSIQNHSHSWNCYSHYNYICLGCLGRPWIFHRSFFIWCGGLCWNAYISSSKC